MTYDILLNVFEVLFFERSFNQYNHFGAICYYIYCRKKLMHNILMSNCMYCKVDIRKDECDVYKCSGCGLYVHLACTNCKKTSRLKGILEFFFDCCIDV